MKRQPNDLPLLGIAEAETAALPKGGKTASYEEAEALHRKHRQQLLAKAQEEILRIARERGEVTIVDIHESMGDSIPEEIGRTFLGSAFGILARVGAIVAVGRRRYSNSDRNIHTKVCPIWTLRATA